MRACHGPWALPMKVATSAALNPPMSWAGTCLHSRSRDLLQALSRFPGPPVPRDRGQRNVHAHVHMHMRQAVLPDLELNEANMRAAFCTPASLLAQAPPCAAQDESARRKTSTPSNRSKSTPASCGSAWLCSTMRRDRLLQGTIAAGLSAPGAGKGSVADVAVPADLVMRDDVAE